MVAGALSTPATYDQPAVADAVAAGLRQAGVPDIEDRFAYLTAGSCGPCRFGMYESEYRRALAQAGDQFTVRWVDNTGESESTELTLG